MTNETTGFNSIVIKPQDTGPDAPGTAPANTDGSAIVDQITPIPTEQEAAPDQKTDGNPNPDRPGWLPEKFKSAEDLAAAYSELEKKLGEAGDSKGQTSPSIEQSLNSYADEFSKSGSLSEKSYGELAKLGMPKKMVDAYIAGQQAIGAKLQNEVFSAAGGADNYREMVQWAATNMSKAEIAAYNEALATGDQAKIILAVRGLAGSFSSSGAGSPPKVRLEGRSHARAAEPFRSRAELTAAMADPRYRKDPAYRADVESRLSKSNIL